jgi:hypothetical protein
MHKQFAKILKIIGPALEEGLQVNLSIEDSFAKVDLQTLGKSHCYLKNEHGLIFAYTRYNEPKIVKTFEDVINVVYECVCYRTFFSSVWLRIFEERGMKDPIGTF